MPIAELTGKAELIGEMLKLIESAQRGGTVLRLASAIEAEIKLRVMASYFREYNHAQDVTNAHPSAHPRVWDRVALRRTQNHRRIDADYRTLAVIFHVAGGAIMRAEQQTRALAKRLVFGLAFPLNAIRHQWSLLNSLTLFRNPSIENARKLLNLYEDGFLKRATELGFAKIKTNKMIYVPAEGGFPEGIDLFRERENTIPVRILYAKELPSLSSDSEYIEDAIVHIHGGGFVALSSHTTQNHTRQWANSL
jgi:acetyl esterase/lipase